MFVPTAKAPPKAGAKELSYNSLNLAYSGQHPCFGPNWFIQFCHATRGDEYGMPRKTLARKQAKIDTGHIWTSVFFCCRASNSQDSPKASPRVIFNWKNIIEQLRLEWMLIERWGRQGMFNVPISMWQDCSFNSLNLAYSTIADSILVSDQTDLFSFATCGDEYGVPRKTLARKQAKIDTGHIWTSVFFCCRASNSQDSPKASPRVIFNWKKQLRLEWMLIERWGRQGMFNVPTSMWQDCSFNSLNLAYSGQHPCFGPNWFIQFCHMWRWIRYA